MGHEHIIEMLNITEGFSGYAGPMITLPLQASGKGEIHALFGENAAPVSLLLMSILFGLYQPTSGSHVTKNGQESERSNTPNDANDLNIGMVRSSAILSW